LEKWVHFYYTGECLEYTDFIITPLCVWLIFFFVNNNKDLWLGSHNPLKRYLIPALSLKIFGSIAAGLVYQYYYGGGDTMNFYACGSYVSTLFFDNFSDFLGLLNFDPVGADPSLLQYDFLYFIDDPHTWTVVRIVAVLDIISLDSYMLISLYFSLFSLYASWKFFTLLCQIYPHPELRPKFAYCIFFIPSVVFWGSGIFKDTLTMSGLYLFTVSAFYIIVKRQIKVSGFLWLGIGLYLMISIRLFFLIVLLPCIALWFFAEYRDKITKIKWIKNVSFPLLMLLSIVFITYGLSMVLQGTGELSSGVLEDRAEIFQAYHGSLGGSSYDLGITDYSDASLIKAIPAGINVTFFRPYLWEAHNLVQMIAALQSLYFLYYTLRTILRCRFSIFQLLAIDPLILFSLTFSLLYGFVAGFTSYNFGALDRYKIPALPFYMITLILVNFYKDKESRKFVVKHFEFIESQKG
jgi:hypothetical protein